jgi:transposase
MQIYAIDVSKENLDLFSKSEDGNSFTKRIKNSFNSISNLLSQMNPDDILCAEYTGVYTHLLAHLAYAWEIKLALASGFDIKHSLGNRKGKSDQLDSERIWEYANRFSDKLIFYTPESELMQELKALFNLRNQLVKSIKTFTASHTLNKENPFLSIAENTIRKQTELFLKEQIKKTEQQITELIEQSEEFSKNFNLITSITGIGKVTAWELIITTGNFKKITSARKAAAYAGVCPYPNQSGGMTKKSRIHFRADKKLKSLLHLCSKTICIHNKEFMLYRQRKMMEGKHFYLVMNNVANKLLRTVYAVVQSQTPFDPFLITNDPRISLKQKH